MPLYIGTYASIFKYIHIKPLRNNSSLILVYSKWFPSGVRILFRIYFDRIRGDNVFVTKQVGMVYGLIYTLGSNSAMGDIFLLAVTVCGERGRHGDIPHLGMADTYSVFVLVEFLSGHS